MRPVPYWWIGTTNGVLLLAGLAFAVVFYQRAKRSEGAEAGKQWGYLFTIVVITIIFLIALTPKIP
jgi:integral membrane sensor domain MASE1